MILFWDCNEENGIYKCISCSYTIFSQKPQKLAIEPD